MRQPNLKRATVVIDPIGAGATRGGRKWATVMQDLLFMLGLADSLGVARYECVKLTISRHPKGRYRVLSPPEIGASSFRYVIDTETDNVGSICRAGWKTLFGPRFPLRGRFNVSIKEV